MDEKIRRINKKIAILNSCCLKEKIASIEEKFKQNREKNSILLKDLIKNRRSVSLKERTQSLLLVEEKIKERENEINEDLEEIKKEIDFLENEIDNDLNHSFSLLSTGKN